MTKPSALVCMAGFKGQLSNREACDAVAETLTGLGFPHEILPIGDGGRGTLQTVQACLGGEITTFPSISPLNKAVEARVLCLPNTLAPHTLFVESSESCGYHLVPEAERDPMRASSHGLGEVLKAAITKWEKSLNRIYVGLGDSAISDAGMGMLSALGIHFYDDGNRVVWGNAAGLRSLRSFKPTTFKIPTSIKFTVLCDVLNPLCGPSGSARTFAPQKGANSEQVKLIEQGMENFAKVVEASTGRKIASTPMTGSAGGLASAFLAFLNADLVQGARFLLDWISFDKMLEKHAFVITGEGKTDGQTLSGKAPWECLERARRLNRRAVVISGALGAGYKGLLKNGAVVACVECGMDPNAKEALMARTKQVLSDHGVLESLDYSSVPVFLEASSPRPS